jgi:hypothetical protein
LLFYVEITRTTDVLSTQRNDFMSNGYIYTYPTKIIK